MALAIKPIEDRRLLGIGLVLASYFCFALIDTSAKWLSQAGLPTAEVVFIRYAGHLLIAAGLFLPAGRAALLVTRAPGLELLRGLCLLGSTVCNFSALVYLPLTVTSSISFTSPLMLCALSIPLLGEQVGWRRWLAIAVGFVGVLVIVQPGTAAFHPAAFLALGGALFSALYFLLTRKLAGIDAVTTQQFYAALIATVCLAPVALLGEWVWPTQPADWVAFAMIGIAGFIGHQFVTIAHRFAPASVLAPFGYFHIIFMAISSWLVFAHPPEVTVYLGAPIVIGSGLYIWVRERQLSKSVVTGVAPQD